MMLGNVMLVRQGTVGEPYLHFLRQISYFWSVSNITMHIC